MYVPRNLREAIQPARGMKMVFIHTPKCGGSFLAGTFGRRFRKCPTLTWPEAAGHLTLAEYRSVFAGRGESLTDYYTFSVVRNPWAWHVSWFTYIRADRGGRKSGHRIEAELFAGMSFADYVDWLEDPDAPRSRQGYIVRQMSDWFVDEGGAVAVDRVLRQEHLREDLGRMIRELGLFLRPPLFDRNVSSREDYRRFYTDREVERIGARHGRDIALFGYGFEG